MIIAHVLSSFGLGGQEKVALDLATKQRHAGHFVMAVSLAAPPEGPIAPEFRRAGVRAETVAKGDGVDASLPVRLAALLRAEHVDVVHTHNPHALIYGAPAAGLARAAIVHTKHGANPDVARRRWLRRVASTLVDACVAVTPTLAAMARRDQDCNPELLHVIPNGIDMRRFAPRAEARRRIRTELGIPEDAWVVGTVGRLAPEKDHGLLIDAMAPLLDERRHLVIVGDGSERDALRKRVDGTLRGAYVHLTGARDDVESLLAAFDTFVLSSKTEGLPLVLLEAMATELPVVSSSVGGIPDVIRHDSTGFLFPSGDKNALTKELLRVFGSPELGRRIGTAGRHAVTETHSIERMFESYDALYRSVLASNHRELHAAAPTLRAG
ncbi:MAG TPA: glycosyltransferase [Polyangiaceae bacterium]